MRHGNVLVREVHEIDSEKSTVLGMFIIMVVALSLSRLILGTLGLMLGLGLSSCSSVSTGTSEDPVLIASGPRATEILAIAPVLRTMDRRSLDCDSLVGSDAGILLCGLMVTCSMPSGSELVFGGIEFPGEIGLAPDWSDRGITIAQRRAITACALAHLSFDGLVGVASMRGLHLPVSHPEREIWTLEEGAYFGDLMAAEPIAVACQGVGDPASSARHARLCAQPDPDRPGLTICGLRLAGGCPAACGASHGPYHRCAFGRGEFSRVITTFVEP